MSRVNEIFEKIIKEVERFNGSFKLENQDESKSIREDAFAEIDSLTADYNKLVRYEAYRFFMDDDNPMAKAIHTLTLPSFKVRTITDDDGVIKGLDTYDKDGNLNVTAKIIDLVEFDKYSGNAVGARKGWQYDVERFNALMCLKVALELGLTDAKREKIAKTIYLSKLCDKIEMGETPTSNTQALKNLQHCIDGIIFEDDGKGKNKYKATSHDIAYIDHLIAKRGKALLTVSVVNSRTTRELITEVLYRILTKGSYSVDYKAKKVKKA